MGICAATSTAQSPQTATTQASAQVPAPTAWQITTRGANHRTWERIVYEMAPGGEIVARNRSYQELASGLCYQDANGHWQDSQEQIEASSFGATAAQGQYHTSFGNNLNSSGAVDQHTGDGKRLRSNILGLAYYDSASGQTVMIARIQDSQGELISANQVLYPNAFSGVKADVRYTYKRGTFEQDVILREQPAAPESLGLNAETTEIEVVTEFIDPPPAEIIERHSKYNSLPDEEISWGTARLGHGRAFDLGEKRGPQNEVQVRRQFITVNGRQVLIEAVPYQKIQSSLASLPTQSSIGRKAHLIAGRTLDLPPRPLTAKNGGPIKMAAAQPPSRGFVLDYVQINANETNFTFQGDGTYLVTGEFDLLGVTAIEGGAVIKMNSNGQLDIDASGSLVCQTGPYRPAVFTSINDNTVGQPVSGSSGTPTSGDVQIFVELNVTNAVLSNLRFAYCIAGIYQPVYPAGFDLWDSQFLDVDLAIYSGSPRLHNVLIGNAGSEGDSAIFVEGPAFTAENVTADNGYTLLELDYSGTNVVALTNCLVTRQNMAVAPFPPQYFTNTSVWLPTLSTPLYKPVGGARYYLTNNSPYHNVGTRAVSSSLLADLAGKTTYPPVVYSNVSFTISTNLSPQAARDNAGSPDLGYHYDPLDYVFGGVNVYSNINFTAGTAVGWFNGGSGEGIGISLHGKAQASFSGTAVLPCVFTRNDMAQEGVNGIWTTQSYLGGIVGFGGNYTQATAPTVNFDFTHCFSRNFEGNIYRDSGDGTLIVINANNTEFYDGGGGAYLVYINFTNCLSVRDNVVASCNCSPRVSVVNCTFIGGSLTAERQSGATWRMMVQNCAFQGTSFTINDPSGGNTNITWCNFNCFLNTDSLPAGQGSHYLTVTNYNWQTGWFGNYYLSANSPLIQQGSTTANKLGLYHFTTQISEVPETNSVVDIGYHYVATDGFGNPLDGNGDGTPDYFEDLNGNGVDDAGEIPWDVSIISQPTNLTVNAGSNATFAVVSGGNSPVSYQWRFNGTNILGATQSTFSQTNVSLGNAGVYSVTVTGVSGFQLASSNAFLAVNALLGRWRFDNTNNWVGDQGQLPMAATNVVGVPSWDTNAVLIDSTNSVILSYRAWETSGGQNISVQNGTLSFWFKPDWTSSESGGAGIATNGRLIEIGNYDPVLSTNTGVVYFTNGWWSFYLTPGGNQFVFASATNGEFQTNLAANITFSSNQWCQLVLTYTPTNCLFYLNSQLITNGTGPAYYPGSADQTAGFRIGSDSSGNNQARGTFENLVTYNYALSLQAISNLYQGDVTFDSTGGGLPNLWQLENFGMIGVDPLGDPSGDGNSNLQKYRDGANPHVFEAARLGYWQFNNPPTWLDSQGLVPTVVNGLYPVVSWSGYAVQISAAFNSELQYPGVRTNGSLVTVCPANTGSVRFWFKPNWQTGTVFGQGPNDSIRLFEIGRESTNAEYGWFALTANMLGNELTFGTEGNGIHTDNEVYPITFTTNNWYQIVLTYTTSNSLIYVNGIGLATNGIGCTNGPSAPVIAQGFSLGSSWDGVHQANGCFDELETFNYPLTAAEVISNYEATMGIDTANTGLPDVVKNAWGLNLAAVDSDCDGLPDAWKIANGLNPKDPGVATPSVMAAYENGTGVTAPDFALLGAQTNILNVAFVTDAAARSGSPVYGGVITGNGPKDAWNFCDASSGYVSGISLANAANNPTSAKLFAYIGPCINGYVDMPQEDDYAGYLTVGTNPDGTTNSEEAAEVVCATYNQVRSESFVYGQNLYDNFTLYDGLPWWTSWGQLDGYVLPIFNSTCWQSHLNSYNVAFLLSQLDPAYLAAEVYNGFVDPATIPNYGFMSIASSELTTLSGATYDSDSYARNLDQFASTNHLNQGPWGWYTFHSDSAAGSMIYTNVSFPPEGSVNCYIPPFASIAHTGNNLGGNDGALWRFSSASQVKSGGFFRQLYPQAKRTLLITGIPFGQYGVYIYYDSPGNVLPVSVNGLTSSATATPAGTKYWYCNAQALTFPTQSTYAQCTDSAFPVWAATNRPGLGYIRITLDSPAVFDSTMDLKLLGLQIVAGTNHLASPASLVAIPGLGTNYLNWQPTVGATNYEVFRSVGGTNSWTLLATTTNETLLDATDIAVGTTYNYYVRAVVAGGVIEPASDIASAVPFGCSAPAPPIIDIVEPLNCQVIDGTYNITCQLLLTNSDAIDPQGLPLVFRVDSVVSGSLMIGGQPFGANNNTISNGISVVWSPPAVATSASTPSLSVCVFDGVGRSTNSVYVYIKQKPPTYLLSWGQNQWGTVGNGKIFGNAYTGNYLWSQSTNGIWTEDPRWEETNTYAAENYTVLPEKVLDIRNVATVCPDFDVLTCAVTQDGNLWEWGCSQASLFGKPMVESSSGEIWPWGDQPTGVGGLYQPMMNIPSPIVFQGTLTNVISVSGYCADDDTDDMYRLILKNDGTLWSVGGSGYGILGRDPNESGNAFCGSYGMVPERIQIDGNNANELMAGRNFVEIQTGWMATLARCADGTVWSWSYVEGALWSYPEFRLGGNVTDGNPSWLPEQVTSLAIAGATPIIQMSARWNHYILLRQDGSVSEMGYVPSLDPEGVPGDGDSGNTNAYTSNPVSVNGLPPNVTQVSAGQTFGAALTGGGNVWVWGIMEDKTKTGAGEPATNSAPRQIASLHNIVKIATGFECVLAIDGGGTIWAWGLNTDWAPLFGTFPNDTTNVLNGYSGNAYFTEGDFYTNAVRVLGIQNATDIFASDDNAYALGTAAQAVPVGLVAEPMNHQVQLSWNIYPAASTYIIYRSLNEYSGFSPIGTSSINSFSDQSPSLVNGQSYFYEVSAVVNGVETQPSWTVFAMPIPAPTPVQDLQAEWACHGVILEWLPPTNTQASPLQSYFVMVDGLQLAELSPGVTNFNDVNAVSSNAVSITYSIVAQNSSGSATNIVTITNTPQFIPCEPAPAVNTNAYGNWFSVAGVDAGSDEATLNWANPTNCNDWHDWLFENYEFGTNELAALVVAMQNPYDSVANWLWESFTTNEYYEITNANATVADQAQALAQGLNAFLTNGISVSGNSLFSSAVANGEFADFNYSSLRSGTTNLFNSNPSGTNLLQLKRMLLDDYFAGSRDFMRGPNWGPNLTGFRIHYQTLVYFDGSKLNQTLQVDVPIANALQGGLQYAGDGFASLLYKSSWPILSGSVCWASVSAIVSGQEGVVSGELGPQMAHPNSDWNPILVAVPGYQQVYLAWGDDDSAIDYNVYYSTNANDTNGWNFYPGGGSWQPVPGGTGLQSSWFWNTNLIAGLTYYYFVQADDYINVSLQSAPIACAVSTDSPPPAYQFSAYATPYDGVVSVDWTLPTNLTSIAVNPLGQTNWQFYVERKPDGSDGTGYEVISAVGYGLAYLDPDVVDGHAYNYRVTAFDTSFNRIQTTAIVENGGVTQIIPSATNGLTFLAPVPGNGYVDLTWSPIPAPMFTILRSLSPAGPYLAIGSVNAANAYQNAGNTYQDTGLQNGVTYYYQITATTPTGFVINSVIQSATPEAGLAPLPPANFAGQFMPDTNMGYFLLTWNPRNGAQDYQVFLVNQGSRSLLYSGFGTACEYEVPTNSASGSVFTLDVRSLSASGLAGDFAEITVTNIAVETPPAAGLAPVVLEVGGSQSSFAVTGPTNLILSADLNIPDVQSVSFYYDGELIGTADTAPYQMVWYHVPGGDHAVSATAFTKGSVFGGAGSTYSSQTIILNVLVDPVLAGYQTSATDLQLPAPSLPIVLSRAYSSKNLTTNSILGVGWSPSWAGGILQLATNLDRSWLGVVQTVLGTPQYYFSESSPHIVSVSLPDGQTFQFEAQLNYGPDATPDEYDSSSGDLSLEMNYQPFAVNQGSLRSVGVNDIHADGYDSYSWNNIGVTLKSCDPSQFVYTGTDGTSYSFSQPANSGLSWLLTQVTDPGGSSLTYTYDGSGTSLLSISNSCGRNVTFNYVSVSGSTNVQVYDSDYPLGSGGPAIVYAVSNSFLIGVQQLVARAGASPAVTTDVYTTNSYCYGSTSGDPDNANLLTDIYDPRGVRIIHNTFTNLNGDLMIQVSPGRTNIFQVDPETYDLTVQTYCNAGVVTVVVNSDESGAVAGATQPVSGTTPSTTNVTQCAYDSQGNLETQTDANGHITTYTYDSLNRLVGKSDGNGNSTSSQLASHGQPVISTDANGNQTFYKYDSANNPISVDDPSDTATTYTYSTPVVGSDGFVRLGELETSENQSAPQVPYTVVTTNTYTMTSAIIGDLASTTEKWVDASGTAQGLTVTTAYTYDGNGNRTSEVKTRTTPGGTETVTTMYTYDPMNRLIMTVVEAATPGGQTLGPQTNTTTYNVLGKQYISVDAAGRGTTNVYDFNGNLIEADYPDGMVSRTSYDGFGRQQYVQDRAKPDASGNTVAPATLSTYDASGRVIMSQKFVAVTLTSEAADNVIDYVGAPGQIKMVVTAPGSLPALTTTLTFYDLAGNVQYSVDARGLVTQNQYDADNRLTNALVFPHYCYWTSQGTGTPTPGGTPLITSYSFDANGNQTAVTDAAGHLTTSQYDPANRLTEVDQPAESGGTVSKDTYYDGLGRKIDDIDEAGVATSYTYDFRGLLTSVTLATGTGQAVTTVYGYDELGNQISQTDAAGHTTTFQYDALGRRVGRVLPGGQVEQFGYDLSGNQILETNFNAVVITNQYDVMNRLTNCASANGYHTSFAFNATNGLRINMVDASGTTVYEYDEVGELTNKTVFWTNGPTISLHYAYSTNGSLTSLWSSSAGGVANVYQYDLLGRLTNVLANGTAAAAYGFDLVGNLRSVAYGNGVTNLCLYDSMNRLTNQIWNVGASPMAKFAYGLGVTGNRISLVENVNGNNRAYNWVYDYLYRLTGETLGGGNVGTINYGYDAVGNRTSRTSSVATISSQTNSFTANDWLGSDQYDSNGNTTNSVATSYQYDPVDHLVKVNNGAILMAYDGDGNRVSKTAGGTTNYYLLDDRNPSGYSQVLEEWTTTSSGTNLVRVYNYGMSLVSQRQVSGITNTYYFVSDGHGSTRELIDYSGSVANVFSYDAYGNLIASNSIPQTKYLYCCQQFDGDLGLYYNRARYLSPSTGRFWTMDTHEGGIENPLSLHKYLYTEGNPVDESDPTGKYTQEDGYAMERLIKADYKEAHPMAEVSGGGEAGVGLDPTLKPDILNTTDKTFAEIKPLTLPKISLGLSQLVKYENSLKGSGYVRDQWPANSIAPLRMVFFNWNPYFYFNVNGLILYTRIDPGTLFVPISIGGAKSLASYSTKALARGAATTFQDAILAETGAGAVGAAEGADIGVGEGTAALTAL